MFKMNCNRTFYLVHLNCLKCFLRQKIILQNIELNVLLHFIYTLFNDYFTLSERN